MAYAFESEHRLAHLTTAQLETRKRTSMTPVSTVAPHYTVSNPQPVTDGYIPPDPSLNVPGSNIDVSRLRPNSRSVQAANKVQEEKIVEEKLKAREDMLNRQREDLNRDYNAGLVSTQEYNQRNTLITQGALRTADAKAKQIGSVSEMDRFLGGRLKAMTPEQLIDTQRNNPDTNPPPSAPGVIEQTRNARLAGDNPGGIVATPEQIAQNAKDRMGAADAGFGVTPSQRSTALRLERANLNNNPAADAAAKREQDKINEIENTIVTKTVTNEKTHDSWEVVDPEATAKARDEVKKKQAEQDAADKIAADALKENQKNAIPSPSIESFIATLPPEQQDQARAYFEPIESFYDQAAELKVTQINTNTSTGDTALDDITAYQKKAEAKNDWMMSTWKDIQDKTLQGKLDAAETQRQADEKQNQYNESVKQAELDRGIRRQLMQNEKDSKDQMNGLGISGGWRSTRISADTIFALGRGEEIVADLQIEKSLAGDYYSNEAFKIEGKYHSDVTEAYDTYESNGFEGLQKFSDIADKIEQTAYGRKQDKLDAIAKMESDYLDFTIKNGENKLNMITKGQEFMLKQVADARDLADTKEKNTWNEAMKYIDTYGTSNKSVLTDYEKKLGLSPGALSSQKTRDELKSARAGGVAGASGVAKLVDEQRTQIQQLYPNADGKLIDTLVYASMGKLVSKSDLLKTYSYMSATPIGSQAYRIQPALTAAEGRDMVAAAQQQLEDQRALSLKEKTVDEMISELQDSKDSSGNPVYTNDDIIRYMSDLGYTHTKEGGIFGIGQHDAYSPKTK